MQVKRNQMMKQMVHFTPIFIFRCTKKKVKGRRMSQYFPQSEQRYVPFCQPIPYIHINFIHARKFRNKLRGSNLIIYRKLK